MIAYKFLGPGGVGLFSRFRWPLPAAGAPGAWVAVDGPLDPCRSGVHACGPGHLVDWIDDELWRIELGDPVLETEAGMLSARGRLVSRVKEWDAAAAAAFADACVERTRERAVAALERAGRAEDAAALARAGDRAALRAAALALAPGAPPQAADLLGFVADAVTMARGSMPDGTAVATVAPPTPAAIAANVAFTAARAAGRGHAAAAGPGGFDRGYADERAWQLARLTALLGPAGA